MPLMYKRLLVCLDNSDHSNSAAALSVTIASATRARLIGCHVYAARLHNARFIEMEDGLPPEYQKEEELKNTREVHDTLITKGLRIISDSYTAVFHARAASAGVEPVCVSREGRNFEEILAEADEQGCDLVSLGRLGLGIVPTSSIGSVAERVARRAKQDVLIAGTTDNEGPILTAIDGSPASFAGLKTAIGLSKVFNRPIEAIAAFDPIFHQSAFRSIAGVLTEEAGRLFRFNEQEKLHEEIIDKGLARIYKGHLDTAAAVASSSGAMIKTTLLSGKASDEIIKYAEKISAFMVVFGRTGMQATPMLDIGSTAENCMRELSCHVLISSGEFIPENAHAPSDPSAIDWTDEAKAILERIPKFARTIVRNMVEDSARQKGIPIVSASFMREVRKRMEGK
ncbi:MAG: universal stress protein [Deltaproteobacteria bacterium]|nr:universal stress protein [Deltaproteobacteria bacterium]